MAKYIIIGLLVFVGIMILGSALGWFSEGLNVAQKEFGPQAALKKYEWFKEQWQMIQKADKDIALYRTRVIAVDSQYVAYGKPTDFTPDIRMMHNKAKQNANDDLISIISNRNGLVRDYMAAASKFNWEPFNTRDDQPPKMIEEIAP